MADRIRRPLAGKRVVITRAPEQARELTRLLEDFGAEVLPFPTVTFREPADAAGLDSALHELGHFDWILFTSQNAVRFFLRRCAAVGLERASWQSPHAKVAAVGPATENALREEGVRVDHVAKRARGGALAAELRGALAGRRILLPRSDRADGELPTALRAAGAKVVEAIAYCTAKPEGVDSGELAAIQDVDVVAFASPSALHHFVEAIGEEKVRALAARARFAAIGPTTARAIRDAGYPVSIEAAESQAAGLAAAIAAHFEQHAGVKLR